MKLVKILLLVALFLSAAGPAQSSQTFHFGEGQSAPQGGGGHTASPPPPAGTDSIHRQHHRHPTTRHSPRQTQYSRP